MSDSPTNGLAFYKLSLAILLATLVLLGSGKLFDKHTQFVTYFRGSVKVGQVGKVFVQFDPETEEKLIPVVIELSAERIAALTVDGHYSKDQIRSREAVSRAVNEGGLRARMRSKSALTGQLFVDLDFFTEEHESYTFPGEPLDGLLQIPSTKNDIERVLESIAKSVSRFGEINLPEMVEHMNSLVQNLDEKISEIDIKGISERTKVTLDSANSTI